jgi:hypothetical protein
VFVAPRRSPPPGEPLWTLGKAGRLIAYELGDDGRDGCEAQLLRDGDFYAGRRFADRAGALAHAADVRTRLEADDWTLVRAGCRCAEGRICEAHPDQPWPHDACPGPGRQCDAPACPYRSNPPHRPHGWQSIARIEPDD